MTLGVVIVVALCSKRRTDQRHDNTDAPTSSLARKEPDPQFQPDRKVTDPHHVSR